MQECFKLFELQFTVKPVQQLFCDYLSLNSIQCCGLLTELVPNQITGSEHVSLAVVRLSDEEEEEEVRVSVQPPELRAAQGGATPRSSSFIPADQHQPPARLRAAAWTPQHGPLPPAPSRSGSAEDAQLEVRSGKLQQIESVQSVAERRPLRQKQRHCLDAQRSGRLQAGLRALRAGSQHAVPAAARRPVARLGPGGSRPERTARLEGFVQNRPHWRRRG